MIGAQRGGTTSLFRLLAAHSQVGVPLAKELQFFSLHWHRGERWYRANFPTLPDGTRTFEATPYYLFHEQTPGRVAALLPRGRFVALLRDPVRRARSHFLHNRSLGLEPLSFEDAVAAEPGRLAQAVERGWDDPGANRILRRYSYLSRGHYAEQLERWYRHVPAERILVLRSEDFFADTVGTYHAVLEFLGLPQEIPSIPPRREVRTDAELALAPELGLSLQSYFDEHNRRLERLLGWSKSWEYRAG